ncbi:putative biopolymer transport protein, ExbD/TolR family [Crocosphaera subtropica ATCC 51142]|uniref:Biopolymer transport protein, ExbD/TolR family n=1 Tax=Crocosphaera subtropica (strain ATCC 51142 / BH68) TaxID=43989 RepID=B1WUR0_CROS5|nr:biopolymer transporter ExbD [Crocosphaera subtropica]ACB50511.1 putative biopolymer transport protein, ExbD/TolR family [Crocosphaera subtropica ATCC 51142]
MRFNNHNNHQSIPSINLIPMLNVMMSVLAFFVLVSMNLTTSPQGVKVELPSNEETTETPMDTETENLIITLKSDNSFTINEYEQRIETLEQLKIIVQDYLIKQKTGTVLLMADKTVAYKNVIDILIQLKQLGEDRVSLAITAENEQ